MKNLTIEELEEIYKLVGRDLHVNKKQFEGYELRTAQARAIVSKKLNTILHPVVNSPIENAIQAYRDSLRSLDKEIHINYRFYR